MANLAPLFVNAWSTTLASSVASGATTSFSLTSATGLPTIGTNQFIPAVVVDTSTSPETVKEYVWITAVSGTTATVVRGAEDSATYAAAALASGLTVAAVATRDALSVGNFAGGVYLPRFQNLIGWSFDPCVPMDAGIQGANGAPALTQVNIPHTVTISNVIVYKTSGGLTYTSGQNFVGIYDVAGNRLTTSADLTTSWAAASAGTLLTNAVTPVTITGGQSVYVAMAVNASSTPNWAGIALFNHNVPSAILNVGATVTTGARSIFWGGASITNLPSTLTMSGMTATAQVMWLALT